MWKYLATLATVTLAATLAVGSARAARNAAPFSPTRPRLVVLISIDQCRGDYLVRFGDLLLPPRTGKRLGGFRYLQASGAWYPDCRYEHSKTVTGVGHSILGTGAQPSVSGIIGNSWFDREAGKSTYCTDDPKSAVVGALPGSKKTPMSAANQMVSTFDDELELATGGQSRTVSISLKDRASILMAGHRVDSAIWFDDGPGGWISSSAYCRNGRLPGWVEELNQERYPDSLRANGKWEPSVEDAALARTWVPAGSSRRFSHPFGATGYGEMATGPSGNEVLFHAARKAVEAEELGADNVPDVLTLNLASNDYVGHRYGPDSPEVLDMFVQTDRQLSEFLNFLNSKVPGGLKNVTFAICADHGVGTMPELNTAGNVPASRAVLGPLIAAAETALDERFGKDDWIASTDNGEIYFRDVALARHPDVPRARLEERVVEALRNGRGIYFCIGKSAVLAGQVPHTPLGSRITQTVHPLRSGDVIVILQPNWLTGSAPIGSGASHGTPFPYDTQVPLLVAGAGVNPGIYPEPVSPSRLAPSLSFLLGIARPSGAEGAILPGFRVAGLAATQ